MTLASGNKRLSGMTLTETIIVLGVVGVLVAGVWGATSSVQEKIRRNRAVQQISLVVNNIRTYFLGQAAFPVSADYTDQLIRRGVIPIDMVQNPGAATMFADHPWATSTTGSFQVSSDKSAVSPSTQVFVISLFNLSQSACTYMAANVGTLSGATWMTSIAINSTTYAIPVTVETAVSACSAVGSANSINYTFRLRNQQQSS